MQRRGRRLSQEPPAIRAKKGRSRSYAQVIGGKRQPLAPTAVATKAAQQHGLEMPGGCAA
jgi:hypothetical protein